MISYEYEGKTVEEILEKENLKPNEITYRILDEKKSIFKGKKQVIKVVKLEEVCAFIKEKVLKIVGLMGIESNIETNIREGVINVSVHSDQNPLLIGKKGSTLEALKKIINQSIIIETEMRIRFNLDIGEYKKESEKKIIFLAKKIARDVKNSKVEAKLDPMNSFERRIIHTALTDNRYVTTISVGEEPNRCILIKPKEN